MGYQRDQIEALHEQSRKIFFEKILGDPFLLTHEDFDQARQMIPQIIDVATNTLKIPADELAIKLVQLREFAAHDHVTIKLPTIIEATARHATEGYDIDDTDIPSTMVNESAAAGVLRTIGRGLK